MQRLVLFVLALAIAAGAALWIAKLDRRTPTTPQHQSATPALLETAPEVEEQKDAAPPPKKAPGAKPWQRVDGCRWKADRWNDGDSFHLVTGDEAREIVARLYFVDTPEAETAYRDRLDEQAAYWGITRAQATEIAHEAAAFTEKRLAAPFTVWTRWRSALGRSALGRVYCVIVTADGRDLNELLVENGLARIYGTRTELFDGGDSRAYLARLAQMEAEAKRDRRGAWRFTGISGRR